MAAELPKPKDERYGGLRPSLLDSPEVEANPALHAALEAHLQSPERVEQNRVFTAKVEAAIRRQNSPLARAKDTISDLVREHPEGILSGTIMILAAAGSIYIAVRN